MCGGGGVASNTEDEEEEEDEEENVRRAVRLIWVLRSRTDVRVYKKKKRYLRLPSNDSHHCLLSCWTRNGIPRGWIFLTIGDKTSIDQDCSPTQVRGCDHQIGEELNLCKIHMTKMNAPVWT